MTAAHVLGAPPWHRKHTIKQESHGLKDRSQIVCTCRKNLDLLMGEKSGKGEKKQTHANI